MHNIYEWLNKEKSRFYKITIEKNGNNDIVLNHKWGGCYSNRGGRKNIYVQTDDEAKIFISRMMKRRKSRGYELIAPNMV